MATALKTLESGDFDVRGKKVLLRVAYDITLAYEHGKWVVPDDTRIRATLPTIQYLLDQGCSIGFLSWLKRPGGKVVEEYRMAPVAEKLAELVGRPVECLRECAGSVVEDRIRRMQPGELVMLENVRFHPEEEKNDPVFARQLVRGFDCIVFDAFAQAMRIHASTVGILPLLPSAAGFLMVKEIEQLSRLLQQPARPFVGVLGGAKISDRVDVMQNLIRQADALLVGGALANTFFAAQGLPIGNSLIEDTYVNAAKGDKKDYQEIARMLMRAGSDLVQVNGSLIHKLQLPLDMLAARHEASTDVLVVNIDQGEHIAPGWAFYDIGPRTVELYQKVLRHAKTIFSNGPMGLFERPQFAEGTKQVAEGIIASGAVSVLGGGDTETIVDRWGWQGKFTHVSTGGGAALEFLAGHEFPVLQYLTQPEYAKVYGQKPRA